MNRTHARWAAGTVLLAAVLALARAAGAQDLTGVQRQRLIYSVKPAVTLLIAMADASIEIPSRNGVIRWQSQTGNSGSGWIIASDGYVVTNGHVVQLFHAKNEERLKMTLFLRALEENVFPQVAQSAGRALTDEEKLSLFRRLYPAAQITLKKDMYVILQNAKRYPAEVKEYSAPMFPMAGKVSLPGMDVETGKDVAIVKIEAKDLPTVRLGDSDATRIGDEIYVAGYPGVVFSHGYLSQETALEASFTRGQISSVKLDVQGANVLQIDAAVTHGNSGGPVFNTRGEVIGMATFGSISESGPVAQQIQGFNFAVPVNTVKEFIRSAGVSSQPSAFDRTWAGALEAFYAGRNPQAIAGFDEALAIVPDLPDALKLRREATVAQQTRKVEPRRWLPYAVVAAVLLGLIVLAAGLLLHRRARRPTVALPRTSGRLVVRSGPLQGSEFPIPPRGLKIGRDQGECQLVLPEATVSRFHALVASDGTIVRIQSVSGTNPTYVNDRAVQTAELSDGDQIRIGTNVLTYERKP